MVEMMQSGSLSPDAKMEITRGLSLTRPSSTSIAALRQIKSDPVYGPQAAYGLGSSAHKLKEANPELYRELSRELLTDLKTTDSPDVQLITLVALGNAGPDEGIETIESMMASPYENIRAAAATALRRVQDVKADQLLVKLASDPVAAVRESVISAMGERKPMPGSVAVIAALCVSEPIFHVRAGAVQLATKWLPLLPDLAPTLAGVAEHDEHEDLRTIARNALRRVGLSG
jgi:hypothetical protein